jgi:methylmalonyl-CoA/ethylmalonyl-CoA epimerase
MDSVLPVEKLHHIGLVVKDYRRSALEFSRFFGIERWNVYCHNRSSMSDVTLYGHPVDHSFMLAHGEKGEIAFQLCQPLEGESIFAEFLQSWGEGMHHLLPTICSPADFRQLRPWLEGEGISIAQSGTVGGAIEYYYLDTRPQLGTILEVLCPRTENFRDTLKPDEVLSFDQSVTGAGRVPIDKFYHVCVLTRFRRLSVRDNFQRLLGINRWFDFDNQTGVTSEEAHYFGKSIDSRFRLSLGRRAGLAVEVVEPVYGPTIYSDMLKKPGQGEGLNHLMTTVCSIEQFQTVRKWLEAQGMPIVQDGQVRDFCYYCYADCRERLAGLFVELLCPLSDHWLDGREDVGTILLGEPPS